MGRFLDYYAILNVPADASAEAIGAAHGARLAEIEAGDLPPGEREERLALLQRAIHVLGDEGRRLAYDVSGEGGVVDEPEPGAAAPLRLEEPEDYCAILGVGRDATEEEIETAYFGSVAALSMMKGDALKSSDMAGKSEALSRAYRALIEERRARDAGPPLEATARLGLVFAALLATAWTAQLRFAVGRLQDKLIVAAGRTSPALLWVGLLIGAFLLWFLMIAFLSGFSTVIRKRVTPLTISPGRTDVKRDTAPLAKGVGLAFYAAFFVGQIRAGRYFGDDPEVLFNICAFFVPLLLIFALEGDFTSAVVLQTGCMFGQLLLSFGLGLFLLGYVDRRIYGGAGTMASLWMIFYFCYKRYERLRRR